MENYNILLKQGKLPKNKIKFTGLEGTNNLRIVGELAGRDAGIQFVGQNGKQSLELELSNGVYRYNFFDGQNYLLDPKNDRVISDENKMSNIAVIGGTDDPVIHAPGFPMLWQDNTGLTHIKALLRKEVSDALILYWTDGVLNPYHVIQMDLVYEEEHYWMFEAVLPEAAQPISYFFETPTEEYLLKVGKGGKYAEPIKMYPYDIARHTPKWWASSVIYNIKPHLNEDNANVSFGALVEEYLSKASKAIPGLCELGINVICLTAPYFTNSFGKYQSLNNDEMAEINAKIAALINEAHAQNMKIVMAVQFNDSNADKDTLKQDYLSAVSNYLNLGIDGFKLGNTNEMSDELLESIHNLVKEFSSDIVLIGDITTDRNFRYLEWVDSRSNKKMSQYLEEILTNGIQNTDCDKLWDYAVKADFYRGGAPETEIISISDDSNLISNDTFLGQVLLFTWQGIPFINGFEKNDKNSAEGLATELRLKELINIRKNSKALTDGKIKLIKNSKYLLGYRRSTLDTFNDVIVNFGTIAEEINLSYDEFRLPKLSFVYGDVAIDGNKLLVGPKSAVIVDYPLSQGQIDIHNKQRSEKLEAVCDKQLDMDTMPRMLYVTLSERCSINCLHCINDSGNITRNGLARDARLWLVDALTPELPFIDYLAFAHGGENIISPVLIPLLDRYYDARGERSKIVHLLSNGMSKFDQYHEAVEHGVTSISISIDGLTSASNDTVRRGSKIDIILKNLASIVALKKEFKLRVGVATTITKLNVNELSELAKILADIGIDWYKVEEMYPINSFGQQIQLDSMEIMPSVISGIEDAIKGSNVVFCDHTDSSVWPYPCKVAESGGLNYWEKDSFLNSTLMHPCRMAWEIVCVDPNGDVHPLTYGTPTAGNLLQNSIRDMVQTQSFRDCRQQALDGQKFSGKCRW